MSPNKEHHQQSQGATGAESSKQPVLKYKGKHPVTALNEMCQVSSHEPQFIELENSGPVHMKMWVFAWSD